MYYHCRSLKYVVCGKVSPPPLNTYDDFDLRLYKFIGRYCGFFPQIWLSRSHSSITGYKSNKRLKQSYYWAKCPGRRQKIKTHNDNVLFGFDIIKGFPVSYCHWEALMNTIANSDNFENQNKDITKFFNEVVDFYKKENESLDEEAKDWINSGCNLDIFLKKYVFVEKDQVVVPSLNLKSAKKIICRNEKQKKKLRKMGFIEDRIEIKNITSYFF